MNKIKKIAIFTHSNFYDSKNHFSKQLQYSLEREGAEILFKDFTSKPMDIDDFFDMKSFDPDLTLSFNSQEPDKNGKFLWDHLKIPHLSILLDPCLFYYQVANRDYSLVSCVDKFDVEWFKKKNTQAYFIPHAIEKSLKHPPDSPRKVDIVFIGSVYDPEIAKETLAKDYSPEILKIALKTIERTEQEKASPYTYVLEEELAAKNISLDSETLKELSFQIDLYLRGNERLNLIRSIHSHEVHIFGHEGFQTPRFGRTWREHLHDKTNIVYHAPLTYPESLEVLKECKISLNSDPFFKNGTHERIFASLMAGALPLTTSNLWVDENFKDGEDILTFDPNHLEGIDEKITKILNDDTLRCEIVRAGQKKVLKDHTWDNRARQILSIIDEL